MSPVLLACQTLGATRVAVLAFSQSGQSGLTGTASVAPEDHEDEERDEVLNICSCLDGELVSCRSKWKPSTHAKGQ